MASNVSATLRQIAREPRSLPRQVVDDAVKDLKRDFKGEIAKDTGGDARLSGVGNHPKLALKAKIEGRDFVKAHLEAGPSRARGLWYWLEYGTNLYNIQGSQLIESPERKTWSRTMDPAIKALIKDARKKFHNIIG